MPATHDSAVAFRAAACVNQADRFISNSSGSGILSSTSRAIATQCMLDVPRIHVASVGALGNYDHTQRLSQNVPRESSAATQVVKNGTAATGVQSLNQSVPPACGEVLSNGLQQLLLGTPDLGTAGQLRQRQLLAVARNEAQPFHMDKAHHSQHHVASVEGPPMLSQQWQLQQRISAATTAHLDMQQQPPSGIRTELQQQPVHGETTLQTHEDRDLQETLPAIVASSLQVLPQYLLDAASTCAVQPVRQSNLSALRQFHKCNKCRAAHWTKIAAQIQGSLLLFKKEILVAGLSDVCTALSYAGRRIKDPASTPLPATRPMIRLVDRRLRWSSGTGDQASMRPHNNRLAAINA